MATSSDSKRWIMREVKKIPYGHPKRTPGKFMRKVFNTILSRWAYSCSSNSLRIWLHRMRGCHIGKGVYIGRYCFLDNMYPEYIYIYDGASVNAESMLLTHFNPFPTYQKVFAAEVRPVVIDENAIVAVRCTIMPGVRVGKFAVISAGMTVEKSVDDYMMCTVKQEMKQISIKALI